jgi:hypothetical protein
MQYGDVRSVCQDQGSNSALQGSFLVELEVIFLQALREPSIMQPLSRPIGPKTSTACPKFAV